MTMTWEWCESSVALASMASCVREMPSASWSEVLEPGYLLPGLRGQLASVNSGVCPHGPESLEVWPMVEETESVC